MALPEGEKLSFVIQITGKHPETPKADIEKFKDAVKKAAEDNGGKYMEL